MTLKKQSDKNGRQIKIDKNFGVLLDKMMVVESAYDTSGYLKDVSKNISENISKKF